MASLTHARPLTQEDGELLFAIDQAYALELGLEPVLTRSSLNFYTRSGHAFVGVQESKVTGFVLAQSVWNGTRPTVYVNRLAVAALDDEASRLALLEAVTKSAYDAAVYDLQVQLPEEDSYGLKALHIKQYIRKPLATFERMLGSRGQNSVQD